MIYIPDRKRSIWLRTYHWKIKKTGGKIPPVLSGGNSTGKSHPDKADNTIGTPGDASIFQMVDGEPGLLDRYQSNSGMPDKHLRVRQSRCILCAGWLSSVQVTQLQVSFPTRLQIAQST